jgi:serine/threonine protein kinase
VDGSLSPGTRLGRYEVVQRLAVGGMAEIYLARLTSIGGFQKHVVLKRILPQFARDADFLRMFFQEARTAATLEHPNVAQVYDMGEERGVHFFAMEYLHGEDCRGLVRALQQGRATLPLEHAVAIGVGAAAGCHYVHEQRDADGKPLGLIHRDINPTNVVVTYTGSIKLVDFGIAKATARADSTLAGTAKGKLGYMSPEQYLGEPLDRRVDVYALGLLLYELTTLRRAFEAPNDGALMRAILAGELAPPGRVVAGYPPELEAIVMAAVHPSREHRPQSARELQQRLEGFARQAGLIMSPTALGEYVAGLLGPRVEPWLADGAEGTGGSWRGGPKPGDPVVILPLVDHGDDRD